MRTYSHLFIMAVLSATAAVSVAQETCVWDSPDGIWSTETVDRPWNGSRYFINGQDVRFNDMLTDDGSLTQSVVTVSGSVLPGTIYFNNTKTVFDIGFTGDSSSIGVDGQVFHSPVFKSGTGDAYVSAPIHSGAVTVNAGRLFITNALDYPERVTIASGAYFGFRTEYAPDDPRAGYDTYTVSVNNSGTMHWIGRTVYSGHLNLPAAGTLSGGDWWMDEAVFPVGASVSAGARLKIYGYGLFGAMNVLDSGNDVRFYGGGGIGLLNPLSGKTVLSGGNYRIGSVAASDSSGGSRLEITGNDEFPLTAYVTNSISTGSGSLLIDGGEWSEWSTNVIINADSFIVGTVPDKTSSAVISGGVFMKLRRSVIDGAAFAIDPANVPSSVLLDNGAVVDASEGLLEFGSPLLFMNTPRSLILSNSTIKVAGIQLHTNTSTETPHIKLASQSVFEIGGASQIQATSKARFVLADGTFRAAEDFTLGAPLRFEGKEGSSTAADDAAAKKNNGIDSNGHTVTLTGTFTGLGGGNVNILTGLHYADSSALKRGLTIIRTSNMHVSNGARPGNGCGTYVDSGRMRIDVARAANRGTYLHGGILEVPSILGYSGTEAPVQIYEAVPGSKVNVFISPSAIASHSPLTAVNVVGINRESPTSSPSANKDIALRNIAFDLINSETGESVPGATFYSTATQYGPEWFVRMNWSRDAMNALLGIHGLTWAGGISGIWDTNTLNWVLTDNQAAGHTNFIDGVPILFDSDSVVTLNRSADFRNVSIESLTFDGAHVSLLQYEGAGFIAAKTVTNINDAVTYIGVPVRMNGEFNVESGSLVATNLFLESEWMIGRGADFTAGFTGTNCEFSTQAPYIVNKGRMSYQMHERAEYLDGFLQFDPEAPDAEYIFMNGTLCLHETEAAYLTGNSGYTNVWFSDGAVLRIENSESVGKLENSPVGFRNGAELQINAPCEFSRGIVMDSGSVVLNADMALTDGTVISVYADTENTISGSAGINVKGDLILNTDGGPAGLLISTDVNGSGTIRKTGPGAVILSGSASKFTGRVLVEEGSLVVRSPHALGDADIIVSDGAALVFENGSIPMPGGKAVDIDISGTLVVPDSLISEQANPVKIITHGDIRLGQTAVVRALTTGHVTDAYGKGAVDGDDGYTTYTKACPVSGIFVDLFGSESVLVWDSATYAATWFSSETNAPLNVNTKWHHTVFPDYSYQASSLSNFVNDTVPVCVFKGTESGDGSTSVEIAAQQLTPLSVLFTSNMTGSVTFNPADPTSQLGTPEHPLSFISEGSGSVTNNVMTYIGSVSILDDADITIRCARSSPQSAFIPENAVFRYGIAGEAPPGYSGDGGAFSGSGTMSKIGIYDVPMNFEGVSDFMPKLGIEEGRLVFVPKSENDTATTVFRGDFHFLGGGVRCSELLNNYPDGRLSIDDNVTVHALHGGYSSLSGGAFGLLGSINIDFGENMRMTNGCYFVPSGDCTLRLSGTGVLHQAVSMGMPGDGRKFNLTVGRDAGIFIASEKTVSANYVEMRGRFGGAGTFNLCNNSDMEFFPGSTLIVRRNTINNNALTLVVTNSGASLTMPTRDSSITVDLTALGSLQQTDDGTVVMRVVGTHDVFAYKFNLKCTAETNSREWALRTAPNANGIDLVLTKAQGAVVIISPDLLDSSAPQEEDGSALPYTFAEDGTDADVIPDSFNNSPDLRGGAVIRCRYAGHTDGTTGAQIGSRTIYPTENSEFWFGNGGDGCWSQTYDYVLILDNNLPDSTITYTQVAVTNQIFYGGVSDLEFGELGYYIQETYGPDGYTPAGTSLVARAFNSDFAVSWDISSYQGAWLVVTMESVPYFGYNISFNGITNRIETSAAGIPRRIKATGIAPVDNIYVSAGNPDRRPFVYLRDVTPTNGVVEADRPLDVSQETYEIVVSAIARAGHDFSAAQTIPETINVSFIARRIAYGLDSDSTLAPVKRTGSYLADEAYMLGIIPTGTMSDDNGTPLCSLAQEFGLGISSVVVKNHSAVFKVAMTLDADGTVPVSEGHRINGILVIEGTDSADPKSDTAFWKVVGSTSEQVFRGGCIEVSVDKFGTSTKYKYYRAYIYRDSSFIIEKETR